MNELFFKIFYVALWVVYVLIRIPHDNRYHKVAKAKVYKSTQQRLLILLTLFGMTLIPLIWVFSNWFDEFTMGLPLLLRLAGILVAIMSLFLFWSVHKALGENWSPILEIRWNHKLVKKGIYGLIRHPMYLQIWIWSISQALIISNWITGLLGILTWGVLYFFRVPLEEKMLVEEFGEEYLEYMKKTGRILPKL